MGPPGALTGIFVGGALGGLGSVINEIPNNPGEGASGSDSGSSRNKDSDSDSSDSYGRWFGR